MKVRLLRKRNENLATKERTRSGVSPGFPAVVVATTSAFTLRLLADGLTKSIAGALKGS